MTLLFALLAGFVLLALSLHLASAALTAWRYLVPGHETEIAGTPFITLLRPVCGLDAHDEETLASSFKLTWPAHELIFCAARADDPAVALLERLIAEHPGCNARVLTGEEMISGNPKLNNLEKGWRASRGEFIAMADSNLLLPPDYLERLLGAWSPGTGLVTSPPIGTRAVDLAGSLECAFLNSFQARWQLAADSLGSGFAQGKTLFWRRDVLERAGGLAALGRDLAEDVASTKAVHAQGLKVRLVRQAFTQPIGPRKTRAVWDRQLRWARVRRDGFPGLFVLEILLGPWPPVLALIGLFGLWGAAVALPFLALWYGAEIALCRVAQWPCAARDIAAMGLRDLMLAPLWVTTWFKRGFEWRGTAMDAPGIAHEVKA
ncbi:MAG: ceramide glucosyltransferase [Paenirhodobacter sp.]|uniref:ceramide glucosyltransferase n=1 Tax=Paenirhodobacter sp. TaxID=1965326 RepID=UPI003D0A3D88